jgi:glucose/arabinose dehydrogenase
MSTHFLAPAVLVLGGVVTLAGTAWTLAAYCEGVATVPGEAISIELVSSQITLPVDLAAPPGDMGRLFVCEKQGQIRVIDLANDILRPAAFLDIRNNVQTDNERGLLSVAFHPKYAENGFFFVHYSSRTGNNTFSRFQVSAVDPEVADPASERVLIAIPHPLNGHTRGPGSLAPSTGTFT